MNTHGIPDSLKELQSVACDLLPATIISTTFPTVPVPPGMTLAAFGTRGYVRDGPDLVYVQQDPQAVTLTGADGTYWLALTVDTFTDYAQWTRVYGTHYCWRPSSTQPADVDGLLVFCQLTVAGGACAAVTPIASRSTLAAAWRGLLALGTLATQNANAVAITSGTIGVTALGAGIAPPTAPVSLAVQGQSSLQGPVGMGVAPSTSYTLVTNAAGPIYFPGPVGVGATPNASYTLVLGAGNAIVQAGGTLGIGTPPGYTLHVQGSMGLNGGSAAIVNTTSRRALKQDIRPLVDGLATLARLQPRQWEWADDQPELTARMPGTQQGFVTEEITQVLPQTAQVAADGTPGHSEHGLLALLVAAVKELTQRVAALEASLPA